MKNYLTFLIFSLFTLFSCTNLDISENNEINNELSSKDGIEIRTSNNFDNISLESIEVLPLQYQREIFIQLSPAKRLELWTARMNKAKLSLNSNQISNLSSIENLFNINYFSDSLSIANEQFINNWVNQMVADSIWNKRDIYYLLCTFTPIGDYVSALIAKDNNTSALPDCNCNGDFYCMFLGIDEYCDFKKNTCQETINGCGFLFAKPCRGRCKLYMGPGGN